ncbi:MAG: hypothetical protein H6737_22480 [Alphaproteobacteria bacterium]|nr:hypothetical protein [Alphaproteobacteria bacterium]
MIATLLLAGLMGCATLDPKTAAATEYVNDVQPLMLENSLLAERLLKLASQVYNEDVPQAGLSPAWNDEIVPLAEHIHIQADAVDVPDEWKDLHDNLVVIWSDRASAYRSMGEAIVLADRKRWKEARELEGQVVKREETWFQTVSTQLSQYDLTLEQYP